MKRTVLGCIVGTFFLRCGTSAEGVMLGLLLAHIATTVAPIPATIVGLLGTSFYIAELLGAPIFGALTDRLGARRFLLLSPFFAGLASLMMAGIFFGVIHGVLSLPLAIAAFFGVRVFQGLSTAASAPSSLSYLSSETADATQQRGLAMGFFEIATIAGMASGFVAGGQFWTYFYGRGFIPLLVIFTIAGLVFWRFTEDRPLAVHEPGLRRYLGLLQNRLLLRFAPAWLAANAVLGAWFTHSVFQMAHGTPDDGQLLTGGFSGSALGFYFAGFALTFALGIAVWGWLLGRVPKLTVMLVAIGGLFLSCLALYGLNHSQADDVREIVFWLALLGVGIFLESGFTPAALTFLADIADANATERGVVMGLYSVFLGVGQLLGAALAGPFADLYRIDGLILFSAILGCIALGALLMLREAVAVGVPQKAGPASPRS